MAGLEVVVRPVVFPDIRPQPARSLPPADDPNSGICEIKGSSSFIVTTSTNVNFSVTFAGEKETKRRVDTARVYQKNDDGTIERENFVDIEVPNKIWKRGGTGQAGDMTGAQGKEKTDLRKGAYQVEYWIEQYRAIAEKPNIEITKRNTIIENRDPTEK